MSFGHDFEDAILALVDEARLDFTAAQEPVDGLIDQTQAPRRSKACAGVETDGQRGIESVLRRRHIFHGNMKKAA